jgi:CRISPR-associated protein Cmr3
MTKTIGVKLEPLDVLFLRDGRPFGAAMQGKSVLPMPQTLAGAVWTALLDAAGCDFSRFMELVRGGTEIREAMQETCGAAWIASVEVRGPWLARPQPNGEQCEVLVPVPAVLHAEKTAAKQEGKTPLHRLRPLRPGHLPGWQAPESLPGLWPLWLRTNRPTESAAGYLTQGGLHAFLHGEPVTLDQRVRPEELFDFDRRTGIGIQPDRLSAEEGLIYGASFLALKPNVFFYADVILPEDGDQALLEQIKSLPLGGEGRRVRSTVLDEGYRWPEPKSPQGKQKPLLLLTTPGCFAAGWRPARLNGRLLAAAVPGSISVSGWDLARGGPKPNRFAAQAGSVYFLNEPLDPWPETLSDNDRDAQQGWGCYLKGVWIDE